MGHIHFDRVKFDFECDKMLQMRFDRRKFDTDCDKMGQIHFDRGKFDFDCENRAKFILFEENSTLGVK